MPGNKMFSLGKINWWWQEYVLNRWQKQISDFDSKDSQVHVYELSALPVQLDTRLKLALQNTQI